MRSLTTSALKKKPYAPVRRVAKAPPPRRKKVRKAKPRSLIMAAAGLLLIAFISVNLMVIMIDPFLEASLVYAALYVATSLCAIYLLGNSALELLKVDGLDVVRDEDTRPVHFRSLQAAVAPAGAAFLVGVSCLAAFLFLREGVRGDNLLVSSLQSMTCLLPSLGIAFFLLRAGKGMMEKAPRRRMLNAVLIDGAFLFYFLTFAFPSMFMI